MPRVAHPCNCNDRHPANALLGNGMPVAQWRCETHGNVFEDRPSGITLTECQHDVLRVISEEHKASRSPTADDISRITNRTIISVERAMAALQAVNFIEKT